MTRDSISEDIVVLYLDSYSCRIKILRFSLQSTASSIVYRVVPWCVLTFHCSAGKKIHNKNLLLLLKKKKDATNTRY